MIRLYRSTRTLARGTVALAAVLLGAAAPAADPSPTTTANAEVEKQRAEHESVCRANRISTTYVDCACASRKIVELAAAADGKGSMDGFMHQAYAACPQPDRKVVAQYVFESCDEAMAHSRKDHEAFCRCTADEFVKRFYADTPQLNHRWRQKLRSESMKACGIGDRSKSK